MPLKVRERIAKDIREIVADPAIAAKLTASGQVVNPGTPNEFAATLNDQRSTVKKIGNTLGIKPAT
jgi:tripartite-type tricarboxylate transporter receptor subunit TctC